MNKKRLKLMIGVVLLLLMFLGCRAFSSAPILLPASSILPKITSAPTLLPTSSILPKITSVPGYPLNISVNPDAFLRFENGKLELFDIYIERVANIDIKQAEVLLELDTVGKRTTFRQGPVAIPEFPTWLTASDWANANELELLFTLMGLKGEGYVRIAFYSAYPADVSPPSPRPEAERLSVWLSIPVEFK